MLLRNGLAPPDFVQTRVTLASVIDSLPHQGSLCQVIILKIVGTEGLDELARRNNRQSSHLGYTHYEKTTLREEIACGQRDSLEFCAHFGKHRH